MTRDLPHLLLNIQATEHNYQSRRGGGGGKPSAVEDRGAHADALLQAIINLPDIEQTGLPGIYLQIAGRPDEPMITTSLNKSGLTLLQVKSKKNEETDFNQAIVFATKKGISSLKGKVEKYKDPQKDRRDARTGEVKGPSHSDLIDSIGALREAILLDLWKSQKPLPADSPDTPWEIWVRRELSDSFFEKSKAVKEVIITEERLDFPDDIVVIGIGGYADLEQLIKKSGAVRSLAPVARPTFFLDNQTPEENQEWLDNLRNRTVFANQNLGYATILDYGIDLSHPLIKLALDPADRHTVDPRWGVSSAYPHGTEMAGLSLYGDLMVPLQRMDTISISHRLESVKILPETGENPHNLYGKITVDAIRTVEAREPDRRRTFIMAVTTDQDTPHDGAPTSWSTTLDQLVSGSEQIDTEANGTQQSNNRLILVSAGNIDWSNRQAIGYLNICDVEEIQSPAQAWNVITVGAYTEKTRDGSQDGQNPLAPVGDLCPASRTASWAKDWPIKPDVVIEGGNYAYNGPHSPYPHDEMALLTTSHDYPMAGHFSRFGETSAATALAGKAISELWAEYPAFWPETIRALFISSAHWTPQMLSHLNNSTAKTELKKISKRYGYGVPDIERARKSAKNSLTMIIQDTIIPYNTDSWHKGKYDYGGLKLYEMPWPVNELRRFASEEITIRVALSTFAVPNPSMPVTMSKYNYASHNLRFDLIRINESQKHFVQRIGNDQNRVSESTETDWQFGTQQRNVGSVQVDWITDIASNFAQRNYLAVYPVGGWWKVKQAIEGENREARFSLIVEIDAENLIKADIYTEIENKIKTKIAN